MDFTNAIRNAANRIERYRNRKKKVKLDIEDALLAKLSTVKMPYPSPSNIGVAIGKFSGNQNSVYNPFKPHFHSNGRTIKKLITTDGSIVPIRNIEEISPAKDKDQFKDALANNISIQATLKSGQKVDFSMKQNIDYYKSLQESVPEEPKEFFQAFMNGWDICLGAKDYE